MDLTKPARHEGCVFCDIVAGETSTVFQDEGSHHVAFTPLNPFMPGHLLFVPRTHIDGAIESAALTGRITEMAVRFAQKNRAYDDFNVITSNGWAATQTINHLHVHLIPRQPDDESGWPWYGPPLGGFQPRDIRA